MKKRTKPPSVWVVEVEGFDEWFILDGRAFTSRTRARNYRDEHGVGFEERVAEYRRVEKPRKRAKGNR